MQRDEKEAKKFGVEDGDDPLVTYGKALADAADDPLLKEKIAVILTGKSVNH